MLHRPIDPFTPSRLLAMGGRVLTAALGAGITWAAVSWAVASQAP